MELRDSMGILCMGTFVKERNQGSEETCMEHMQSSKKKKGGKRPHDKITGKTFLQRVGSNLIWNYFI